MFCDLSICCMRAIKNDHGEKAPIKFDEQSSFKRVQATQKMWICQRIKAKQQFTIIPYLKIFGYNDRE